MSMAEERIHYLWKSHSFKDSSDPVTVRHSISTCMGILQSSQDYKPENVGSHSKFSLASDVSEECKTSWDFSVFEMF
jgi:hypothetical protein